MKSRNIEYDMNLTEFMDSSKKINTVDAGASGRSYKEVSGLFRKIILRSGK